MCPWQWWCITGCLPSRWQHETTCMFHLLFIHWGYNVKLAVGIHTNVNHLTKMGQIFHKLKYFKEKNFQVNIRPISCLNCTEIQGRWIWEFKSKNVLGVRGACPQSPLEACAFGVHLANQAVFILFIRTWLRKVPHLAPYIVAIINNYWTRFSKISWFVCGEQINYLPLKPLASANNWSARHW